jgi:hypothetical protein
MNPENPLLHAKHVFRLIALLVIAIVALVLGRGLFVPETWGAYGSYRGANVAQQMAQPVIRGGDASCRACHEKEYDAKLGGAHATVRCESCHGPVTEHAREGEKVAEMPKPSDNVACLWCHEELESRPTDFPQVDPRAHVKRMGEDWTDHVCLECHLPHEPSE